MLWYIFLPRFAKICRFIYSELYIHNILVTFWSNKYKSHNYKFQGSAVKLSYQGKKRKIDLGQKPDKDFTFLYFFLLFFPLYVLDPSNCHQDLLIGHKHPLEQINSRIWLSRVVLNEIPSFPCAPHHGICGLAMLCHSCETQRRRGEKKE